MKKGFTLVELLAVITLIALIIGFATPAILKRINSEKDKISDMLYANITAAANIYVKNNKYGDTMTHYIKFKTLVDNELLDSSVLKDYPNHCVKAVYASNQYSFEVVNSCVEG